MLSPLSSLLSDRERRSGARAHRETPPRLKRAGTTDSDRPALSLAGEGRSLFSAHYSTGKGSTHTGPRPMHPTHLRHAPSNAADIQATVGPPTVERTAGAAPFTPGRTPSAAVRGVASVLLLAACGGDDGWPSPPPQSWEAFLEAHAEWRAERREALVTPPSGPLLWIGLWELHDGSTPFGSDPALPIVLPPQDAPPLAGTIYRAGQEVSLEPVPGGGGLRHGDGAPVTGSARLATDRTDNPTELAIGSLGMRIHAERGTDRLWLRVWDEDSPVRDTFALPEQYPPDTTWRVAARFEAFPEPRTVPTPDVTGGIVTQRVPGELVFRLGGREHRLLAAADTNSTTYFVMVWDSTALSTTYQAGRYVRAPVADSTGWTVLDFNRTYNPPCVFTAFSVCAFPPPENRLPLAITAGEKRPAEVATPH